MSRQRSWENSQRVKWIVRQRRVTREIKSRIFTKKYSNNHAHVLTYTRLSEVARTIYSTRFFSHAILRVRFQGKGSPLGGLQLSKWVMQITLLTLLPPSPLLFCENGEFPPRWHQFSPGGVDSRAREARTFETLHSTEDDRSCLAQEAPWIAFHVFRGAATSPRVLSRADAKRFSGRCKMSAGQCFHIVVACTFYLSFVRTRFILFFFSSSSSSFLLFFPFLSSSFQLNRARYTIVLRGIKKIRVQEQRVNTCIELALEKNCFFQIVLVS